MMINIVITWKGNWYFADFIFLWKSIGQKSIGSCSGTCSVTIEQQSIFWDGKFCIVFDRNYIILVKKKKKKLIAISCIFKDF